MSAPLNATSGPEVRHLLITGAVQGVGYRWNMVQQARRLELTGWVRNRNDGCVEALACGGDEQLAALIAWSLNGPSGARVQQVHVERVTEHAELGAGFAQRATE